MEAGGAGGGVSVSGRYTYGDTDLAAERLGLVAEILEPTTRAFLERTVALAPELAPELAIDVGCGPGRTTRLIHEVARPIRTVGLDASPAFVERAKLGAPDGVDFLEHDARDTPFPAGPADLIFCRLLLGHLAEPREALTRWMSQLRPGGVLLVDELESITPGDPAAAVYIDEVVVRVVASQGAQLFVGPSLHAMADPPGAERISDDVAAVTPPASASARVFQLNVAVLTEREEMPARPDLAEELARIASGADPAAVPSTWRIRQIAFRRQP